MKKILVYCFCVLMLSMSSFASSFIATIGMNADVYGNEDNFVDVSPVSSFGYGFNSETNFLGGILPEETYLVGSYARYQMDSSDAYTASYSASVLGLWYLHGDHEARVFSPFFSMQVDLDNLFSSENSGDPVTTWNGNLGLGATRRLTDRAQLFGNASLSLAGSGPLFTSDVQAGLRFSF